MLCSSVLQRGQLGLGCLVGFIRLRYLNKNGDLLQRSCDRMVLVRRSKVDSDGSMGGGSSFSSLLCCLLSR